MAILDGLLIRSLKPDDSIPVITELLHTAYRPLAEQGLRFLASHQSDEVTLERLTSGYPLVAELDGTIVATITRYGPDPDSLCPWFRRADIQWLGQLAVRPDLQGRGLGRRMFDAAENQARDSGCKRLVLDTSEGATQLREWYERRGFRVVDLVQWDVTNYRSVVMVKELAS